MTQQLFLDLDFTPPEIPEQVISEANELRPRDLRQATLAWVAAQQAAGFACNVPTRLSSYKADIAAFWNQPRRFSKQPGPERLYVPTHTMIIECRRRRQDCWPDFTRSSQLLPALRQLKTRRGRLQEQIRANEPHLREDDVLFDEFSEWRYDQSVNPEYQQLGRQIEQINRALYQGTRFESIRSAHLADFLYLAVPEATVHPNELADGWGLLWIKPDLSIDLIVQAEAAPCPASNRFHLVQNLASAASREVLFSQGIRLHDEAEIEFLPRPRRRRSRRRSS